MTTITPTNPHIRSLEFDLIRLQRRLDKLAEAAREVCQHPADAEAVVRLRALVQSRKPQDETTKAIKSN